MTAASKPDSTGGFTAMGERIMYQRISTRDQNLARQETIAKEYNVNKIFVDIMSGKDAKQPELEKMLAYVREGDV